MYITKHADASIQQRGFTNDLIYLIESFGSKRRRPGNAWEIMITKKEKRILSKKLKNKRWIQALDKISGKILIISDNDTLITAYNKN